ncbi:MAG: glutamine-synthetase adenylyltransferase [Rhodospirillales bacterium RIFCSPLOWO2_12_FULL_58_28]|nr:MAG: glutamine-synthetase adenylyltransferase [Rhodospirillales bacterium RIFCSPLOWO2_02_FULL_58_16]OHC78870.1 MAG: glutamine-synthetase adenylyltransferase [Rhodospirillales bacterium RIFCSPLOWO2_12_FULL_58_28]
MQHNNFASEPRNLPDASNCERAALGFGHWREALETTGLKADNGDFRRLLEAIFGNSPFLTQCALSDPAFTLRLLEEGPDIVFSTVMEELGKIHKTGPGDHQLATILRIAKRRIALTAAVADIACVWPLEKVTALLSDFAEAAIGCAAAAMLRDAAKSGVLTLADEDDPEKDSGLIIIAMGKLGARELNYSSDIDLIVFYDPEKVRCAAPDKMQTHIVRLTRNIMRLLDERTADGYVFRTDLRLRPDPGATPVAVSLPAAEIYYETLGQNWERAAMIKARAVAGDREAGADFIKWLEPFIWRKNLDFATIQDIHSIKRQINAQRHLKEVRLAGHNVKLGHGGIREIEFFAQTQQLIWGGRQPGLRDASTVKTLGVLADMGHISAKVGEEMIRAYRFLRTVEHRLQMINDEQTHSLPEDDEAIRELAVFLGYGGTDDFASELLTHLGNVESNYADLFDEHPSLGAEGVVGGNLVFTGGESDPETLKTLKRLGYVDAGMVDETVRKWHHGRYRSTRSTRTRGILTELMPLLLKALAGTPNPDASFLKFDEFLSRLPSGVQLFSMLYSNPHLLDLIAEIIGKAPRLADYLSCNTSILDNVLTADFFAPPPQQDELDAELTRLLERGGTLESVMNISRSWANDRKFQVGVQSLRGHITPRSAGRALSNIAECALSRLLPRVEEEFAVRHGRFPGSGLVIVAMGKLGGGEMTPVSDLDLILIYKTENDDEVSDGPRPLSPSQYFARFCQRLISAVTAQTAEGRLYEVDMRLRPSGKAGPIASGFKSFEQYQRESAWTWEHMALTRARAFAGPPALREKVEATIRDVLTAPRDADKLRRDVAEMRLRMDGEFHTGFIWDVKHLRGGLVDIEFIAQYLQLRHAHDHPEILSANTKTALERLHAAGFLDDKTAKALIDALDLWQMLQLMLRLTIAGHLDKEPPEALLEHLAKLTGCAGGGALRKKIIDSARQVHDLFNEIVSSSP